ncbi:general secretion pathway protein GspK [Luteimonas aestuarii]|uniref:Type II secretion system protein K n=1 Tax=Luteimonas aestuarii TaxID=453837 RepID=A0A4V3AMZ3_9GAMM|nr:type II secretion system minor pseudopilin GspK [Luteimonas aestuarii]TDK28685.1 general secretion pathway protein GspK [Luteimonas aestuarii]
MALLTVLLLAMVMSVLVVAMLDDVRFGLRRSANASDIAQARWYAQGVEQMAMQRIAGLASGGSVDPRLWQRRIVAFPVEEGHVEATIEDGSRCFNLNSVVEGMPGQWQRRELGVRQYLALLAALGFPAEQAETMADALVDWIDSDQVRSPRGAEDAAYLGLRPAYRTSATLLADASELRAIHGYAAPAYARLRRHVCALPMAAPSPLNVNALTPDDAPLLSMLTLGALDPLAGARIIAARPASGWRDAVAFWATPGLASSDVPSAVYEQVSLRGDWFRVSADVRYMDARVDMGTLLHRRPDGRVALVARRWSGED